MTMSPSDSQILRQYHMFRYETACGEVSDIPCIYYLICIVSGNQFGGNFCNGYCHEELTSF